MICIALQHFPTPGQTLQSILLALQPHTQCTSVARQLDCRLSHKRFSHSRTAVKCITVIRVHSVVTLAKGFIPKDCHSKDVTYIVPDSCNVGIRAVSSA